jgi:hypothetical protein
MLITALETFGRLVPGPLFGYGFYHALRGLRGQDSDAPQTGCG